MSKKTVHNSNVQQSQETKLSKWFLMYEFIYIGICILCKFKLQSDSVNERLLLIILSGISILFIAVTAISRIRSSQYKYMTNIFVLALFTIIVLIWCVNGDF